MEENTESLLPDLLIDHEVTSNLKETSRWARFIAIVSIIGIALLILCMSIAGSYFIEIYSKILPGVEAYAGILVVIVIISLIILGIMMYFLLRFSSQIRKSIETQDQDLFNKGLYSLQIYFTIGGIIAILTLLNSLKNLVKL